MADATALLVTVKGLPLAYNKDLQETQQPLFDAADTVLSLLPLVSGWMKAVEFNLDRMQQAAQSGFMNAWAGATYLVRQGVPFRLAHEQIGKAVQICIERNCELADLPLEELRQLNPAFDQDFYSSSESAGGARYSRCSGRHGAGASSAGHCRRQEKSGNHAGGRPCARVKPFFPTPSRSMNLIAAYSG